MPLMSTFGNASIGQYGRRKKIGFVANAIIAVDTINYNIKADALSKGWDGISPLTFTVTINSGVSVYSNSTGTAAFDTGNNFPLGSIISVINNGRIVGCGGSGGSGGGYTGRSTQANCDNPGSGSAGNSGGLALSAQYAVTVTNNGTIGGGGGGGGGSGSVLGTCGGGGLYICDNNGWGGSWGGSGAGLSDAAPGNPAYIATGVAKSWMVGGSDCYYPSQWYSGNGGALGQTGGSGSAGAGVAFTDVPYNYSTLRVPTGWNAGGGTSGGAGGSPGAAVQGNSNITWTANGTRIGAIN